MGIRTSYLFIFSILFLSTTLHAQGTLPFSETGSYGTKFEVNTSGVIFANRYFPANGAIDIFNAQSNGSTRWILGVYDNLHMTFNVAGSERIRIKNNGYVGIGTTSPLSTLHVAGAIRHTTSLISQGTSYSSTWMQFTQNQYGNSLILGSGGLTALGSGESATQVKNNIGASTETLYLSSDNGLKIVTNLQSGWSSKVEALHISNNGNVGLGTSSPGNKLEVNGIIRSKEIIVETIGWPDFVFAPEYQLPSLTFVENYIKEHGHLPGMPSQDEVEEHGQELGENQKLLLQKIEELTLYVIELKKENEAFKEELTELKSNTQN